jgi:diguanylate cyclase (GGDEF)-like protein
VEPPRALALTAAVPPAAARAVRALAAVAVVTTVLSAFGLPGTQVFMGTAVFAAAGLCLLRARIGAEPRGPWLAFGVAILLWAAGSIVVAITTPATGEPGLADAFWCAYYLAAYVGVGLLVRSRLRKVHPIGWLDGAIGACSAGALAAAVLFEPVRDATGGALAAVAINLAYPLLDLLLVSFVAVLIAIEGRPVTRSRKLLGAAMIGMFICDTVFLLQATASPYDHGTLLDAGWPMIMTLLGLAAWEDQELHEPVQMRASVAMAMPTSFTLIALALVIYGNLQPLGDVALVFATATLLLGVLRTALSLKTYQELALRRRQAVTDELTGLANRRALFERLRRGIAAHDELALLLIDLDGFKEVNDSLGHNAGDLLLREIGPRLRDELRDSDMLARLGGDEFGVVLEGAGVDDALAVAARIRNALERPIDVEGLALMVDASIGVATFPLHGNDAEALMQYADVAMYHAKAARTGCEVYTPERDASSRDRLALLGRLRHAIDADELLLHYQPKAELSGGDVVAVEALVRWQHPERGLLGPGEFLPVAEQTALMRPLTLRVLDAALADCRRWLDSGRTLGVAVNLAVANLIDRGFPAEVAAALDRHGVPAELLQLEITENVVMADPTRALEVLDALRELGVGLSLDDFGTGHSSLAYLLRLAVDEIKIDRSFVAEMVEDPGAAAIVRHTIDLARSLQLRVVAEGAEDEETWTALERAGCDLGQGYFLSRPVPAAELEAWLPAAVS